ncbi:MAG: aminotransferase class I/II-fold pyridoxal phosphate-dependent enzyme [Planctomycetota bacterium]|nr:aminotransferase class I/II-fold pyridoxal phosphate-dependent enzyme [Planctomycetota bacterium]
MGGDCSKYLAERTLKIEASGIRKIFDLAATLKSPVDFSIGQPDFDVPDALKEAAVSAIRSGFNRYTPSPGIPELRRAIIESVARRHGYRPEACMVTCGTSGALTLAIWACVGEGCEVLVPDPHFVSYRHLVRMACGEPVFYDTYPDFLATAERIEAAATPRSRVLILNSPANPTGAVVPEPEMRRIADLARRRDWLVISDEVYDMFSYDAPAVSFGVLYDKTIVVNGFSKSAAMTGWRVGYATGPAELIEGMCKLQQFTFVNAPAPMQKAALAALEADLSGPVAAYRRKRDRICEGLAAAGYSFRRPGGAFYVFPEAPGGSGEAFVSKAIRENLLLVPGGAFSMRDTHFRISYAVPDRTIEMGLDILARLRRSFS